jgi:hypothetical protein
MANPYEIALPNIAGTLRRNRLEGLAMQDRATQREREQFADQEMRAQLERGNQFRHLAGQAYGAQTPGERQPIMSQAAAADPQGAMALDRQMGANDDRKQERLGLFARVLTSIPEENNSARMLMYQQMRPEMLSLGIDAPPEYTPEVGQMAQKFMAAMQGAGQTPARVAGFQGMTQGMSPEDVERARRIDLGLDPRQSSAGLTVREIVDNQGRKRLVSVDPRTGQGTYVDGIGGASLAEMERMKAQGKADVELATAPEIARQTQTASTTAKTQTERQALQISEGLSAADSMPVINRAIELLDSVSTGGLDAAKLAATNFFGVTGADEGELSNNLGKAVLSQLRATFGAQFTQEEGKRLEGIEAGFGKSTAANKRLMEQVKTIVERSARRGLQAAQAAGDDFTAQEIQRSLDMRLTPGRAPQPSVPSTTPASSGGAPPSFATEAEAEAAGLRPGTRVVIGGVPGTWQ